MKRHFGILIGAIGLVVVGLALTAGSVLQRAPSRPDLTSDTQQRQIALAPYTVYGVCVSVTRPNRDPEIADTTDVYCNGDRGTRHFYQGVMRRRIVWFKDTPRRRLDETYAADGKRIVAGFSLRDDGTKQWEASPDGNGTVVLTRYWWNGNIFSQQKRVPNSPIADTMYFYADGTRWAHVVGYSDIPFEWAVKTNTTVYDYDNKLSALYLGYYGQALPLELGGKQLLVEAQVWNADGKPVAAVRFEEGKRVTTVYRANGTRWFEQRYRIVDNSDEGGRTVRQTVDVVSVYSDDGTRATRLLRIGGSRVEQVTDLHADGSKVINDISYAGFITKITKLDPAGKVVSTKEIKVKQQVKIELEAVMLDEPPIPNPTSEWDDSEAKRFKRTIIQ